MKKYILVFIILLYTSILYAQEKGLKQEIKLSYGILTLPNLINSGNGTGSGGFTASYMYRAVKWFWVGANVNWQIPSETQYYNWREYYADGTFKDFANSTSDKFLAFAPEVRFSYANTKWVTLYSSFSAGYGIYTGNKHQNDAFNNYYYWDFTYFGANFHIGRQQKFFLGFEMGVGFKGLYTIHAGYRF